MSIRFQIDEQKLKTNRKLIAWYRLFGAEFLANAQALAGARISGGTGRYERSFTVELKAGRPPQLLCGNGSPIAIYVEEDTDPHIIEPTPKGRKAKPGPLTKNPDAPGALHWFAGAKGGGEGPAASVFAKKVHHPGTKGQHIVRDAVLITGENLRAGTHRANVVD